MSLTVAYVLAAHTFLLFGADVGAWDEARFTAADDGVVVRYHAPRELPQITAEEVEDGDGGSSAEVGLERTLLLPRPVVLGAPPCEHRRCLDAVAAHDARGPPEA